MLNDLKILNGDMPLKFDPLNTVYTITLNNNADDSLNIEYKVDDNTNVSIVGNSLKDTLNEVVITAYNDKNMTSYYLYVYKEFESNVVSLDNLNTSLEVEYSKSDYILPVIASISFLFILILFTLLFSKKKLNPKKN